MTMLYDVASGSRGLGLSRRSPARQRRRRRRSLSPILAPVEVPIARDPPPEPAPTPRSTRASLRPASPPSAFETALKEWTRKTQCAEFDYHPNGGIQSFWCHRPGRVTVASVRELAGVDIFTKGPHAADALKLDAASEFGQYNPAFVRWLVDKVGPSERGSAAQKATQPYYDAHMRPLAEIFWKTYVKAQADQACFAREKAAYADLIAKKKLPKDYYERWFFFMNPYFCDKAPKPANFYYDNGVRRRGRGQRHEDGDRLLAAPLHGRHDGHVRRGPEEAARGLRARADDGAGARGRPGGADPHARGRGEQRRRVQGPEGERATAAVAITVSPDGHLSARLMAARAQATPAQATCIENKFAAQQMTPFDGESLVFNRTIALK